MLLIGWRPWRRRDPAAALGGGRWSTVLWLTLGMAALHWLMVGAFEGPASLPGAIWPTTPLRNFPYWHWSFFVALGLLPVGLLEAWPQPAPGEPVSVGHHLRTGLVWLGRLLWAGAALYFTLISVIDPPPDVFAKPPPHTMTLLETAGFLVLGALPIFALVALTEPLAEQWPGATLPLSLWLIAAGSSICFVLLGSIPLALSAAALAIALGGLVVLAWWQPELRLAGGSVTVVLVLLGAQWAAALFRTPSTGHAWLPAIIALALPALWLGTLPWVSRRSPAQAVGIRLGFVAIPVAVCVSWAAYLNVQVATPPPAEPDPWADLLKSPAP